MAVTNQHFPHKKIVTFIKQAKASSAHPLLIALDGRSGVGKSTLARAPAHDLDDCCVVQGDDFYAGASAAEWDTRSAEEKANLCMDWRRLKAEALLPLVAGRAAAWRPFDYEAGHGLRQQPITAQPAALVLLDGVYSARPELADIVDIAIWWRLQKANANAA